MSMLEVQMENIPVSDLISRCPTDQSHSCAGFSYLDALDLKSEKKSEGALKKTKFH